MKEDLPRLRIGEAAGTFMKPGAVSLIAATSWHPHALQRDPEDLSLVEKIQNEEVSAEEMARFKEIQQERTRTILHADAESFFKIEEVSPEIPPRARIVASEICDFCGELTKIDLLREIDGRKACIPCAHGIIGTVSQ